MSEGRRGSREGRRNCERLENPKTRDGMTEGVEQSHEQMSEQLEEEGKVAEDHEGIDDMEDRLELGATEDSRNEVKEGIRGAKREVDERFEKDSQDFDKMSEESEEYEGNMKEMSESAHRDLAETAERRMNTEEGKDGMLEVKEKLIKEGDFIDEMRQRLRESRERSQKEQDELRGRVRTKGRD